MDYKERYTAALKRAKEKYCVCSAPGLLEHIFPELKESEDERIRKELMDFIYVTCFPVKDLKKKERFLAWLEKQGEHKPYGQRKECEDCQFNYAGECKGFCQMKRDEQEPVDEAEPKFHIGDKIRIFRKGAANEEPMTITKIDGKGYWSGDLFLCNFIDADRLKLVEQKPANNDEPKFHPGDWIIDNEYGEALKVTKADANSYEITTQDGEALEILKEDVECNHRLWTISDADDGDVLASDLTDFIFLFRGIKDNQIDFYCYYDTRLECSEPNTDYRFGINEYNQYYDRVEKSQGIHPATKEQRDLLFQTMKEKGYEWDGKKKELKNIKPKTLDSDKVIEWLRQHSCAACWDNSDEGVSQRIEQFKKDFEV